MRGVKETEVKVNISCSMKEMLPGEKEICENSVLKPAKVLKESLKPHKSLCTRQNQTVDYKNRFGDHLKMTKELNI